MIGIMFDVWREARSRRWFFLLFVAISLILLILLFFLRLEIVDGALTASRFFGVGGKDDIQPVDVALRSVFVVFSKLLFYGGLLFGIVACSEFAPNLFAPGRIELLLSFPVARVSIVAGTFIAIAIASFGFATYATLGVTLVMWAKAGVFLPEFVFAGGLAVIVFMPIYAAMLTCAIFVRSSAVSAVVGMSIFFLGQLASYREAVVSAMSSEWVKMTVNGVLRLFPPIQQMVDHPMSSGTEITGTLLLAGALLCVAVYLMEGKDF
ncbi:MAG: hypothetical protein AAF449_21120 [Myxococcota bacterium]